MGKKDNETHFGYKDHMKCDEKSKIIVDAIVMPANVTDVEVYPDLIDEKDNEVRMDAGYVGSEKREQVEQKLPECKTFFRNKQLAIRRVLRKLNSAIMRIRARIEYIFGQMSYCMGGLTVRSIGLKRVSKDIVRMNLAYNIQRFKHW